MRSTDDLNILYDQVVASMDIFFHDITGIFQDDDNNRVHLAQIGKEGFGELEIGTPLRIFGMCWRRLGSAFPLSPSSIQGLGEILMQQKVTLQKQPFFLTSQIPDLPRRYENQTYHSRVIKDGK